MVNYKYNNQLNSLITNKARFYDIFIFFNVEPQSSQFEKKKKVHVHAEKREKLDCDYFYVLQSENEILSCTKC